jgi:peptidoglycan hydrolase-like protein with peptidoglycan-binding domain
MLRVPMKNLTVFQSKLTKLGGSLLSLLVLFGLLQVSLVQAQTSPFNETTKVLHLGSRGASVTRLQQRLLNLGFYRRTPNGNFDIFTKEAVIEFQRSNALPANGIVDGETRALLFDQSTSDYVVTDSSDFSEVNDGVVAPIPIDSMGQEDFIPTTSYTSSVLQIGDIGPEVEQLQRDLTRLGYYQGPIEGLYDFPTETAVRNFQRDNNLAITGIADQETLAVLSGGDNSIITQPPNQDLDQNPYVVVIPGDNNTLMKVQPYIADAFLSRSGRGSFVQAGSFGDRAAAESRSYFLRSVGLDARVIHR